MNVFQTPESLQSNLPLLPTDRNVLGHCEDTETTHTPSGHGGMGSTQAFLLICHHYRKPDSVLSDPPKPLHYLRVN